MFRRIWKRTEFLIMLGIYRVCLDIVYNSIISVKYAYFGFINAFNTTECISSYLLLFALAVPVSKDYLNRDNKLSREVIYVLFMMSYVPFTTLWAFGMLKHGFIWSNVVFWALLVLLTNWRVGINIKSSVALKGYMIKEWQIKLVALFFGLVILYISGRYTHFRFSLNLMNVYDFRADARTFNLPTVLVYLHTWTRTVFCVLISYFILRKKYAWAAWCFIVQLLNFSIDGSKTTLFLTVFSAFISLMPNLEISVLNKWVSRGFAAISLLAVVAYYSFGNIMIASLFIRRVLFLPVDISTKYYDFFTTHVPDFYRQSFLRVFGFRSPYDTLAYMITERYYGTTGSANNGLIADAISNMGMAGIVIMPMIYAFVFKLLDKFAQGLDKRLYLTVALYASLTLVNTFLFRVLLTHGLLIAMILMNLMKDTRIIKTRAVKRPEPVGS